MLDLEGRLIADAGGAYRDSVVNSLATERAAIRRTMDAGLAPAEFDAAGKLLSGIDAATRAVQVLWKTAHPR
jgi:hypothetical protein